MRNKVWFITGTSRGFGRVWAQAALARGDRVAATARDVKTLAESKPGRSGATCQWRLRATSGPRGDPPRQCLEPHAAQVRGRSTRALSTD
jgi:NAD(P)-dependent dehydrogenase (short-subunit alcohol dehydrogenase family)